MTIVWFVFVVGVLNFGLGFALAWIVKEFFRVNLFTAGAAVAQAAVSHNSNATAAHSSEPVVEEARLPIQSDPGQAPDEPPDEQTLWQDDSRDEQEDRPERSEPAVEWSTSADSLVRIGETHSERIEAVSAKAQAADHNLLKSSVHEALNILISWKREMQVQLDLFLAAVGSLPGGLAVKVQFEELLFGLTAQVETSLSNLKTLDATAPSTETQAQFSSELSAAQQSFESFRTGFTELRESALAADLA